MSRVRSRRGGSSTYSSNPPRVQEVEVDEDGAPKCSGHGRRCKEMTAGQHTKNPGRKFYTCPLGKSDPDQCKFFKWSDELKAAPSGAGASSSKAANLVNSVNQTLGQSPQAKFGRPTITPTPTAQRMQAPITPNTAPRIIQTSNPDDEGEIDWDQVDTDSLERDAIASTPGSTQKSTLDEAQPPVRGNDLTSRLLGATGAESALGKRRRAEDLEATPTRATRDDDQNPFVSPSKLNSPAHHALSPSLSSFEQLSEHLHRQDRLIRAGEMAKEGFRKTIKRQQERIEELEKRVKELEQKH